MQAVVIALDLRDQSNSSTSPPHLFRAKVVQLACKFTSGRSAADDRECEELGSFHIGQGRLRGLLEQFEDATADPARVLDVLCAAVRTSRASQTD